MRWGLFATVQLTALGGTAAAIVHGPSIWTGLSTASLLWLTRRLFSRGPSGARFAAARRETSEKSLRPIANGAPGKARQTIQITAGRPHTSPAGLRRAPSQESV